MEQRNFRGTKGAFHINCHSCGADAHLVDWDADDNRGGPSNCPYCSSEDIWYADESFR